MPFADDTIEVLDEVLFTPFILRSDFVFLISIENGTIIFILPQLTNIVGIDTRILVYS